MHKKLLLNVFLKYIPLLLILIVQFIFNKSLAETISYVHEGSGYVSQTESSRITMLSDQDTSVAAGISVPKPINCDVVSDIDKDGDGIDDACDSVVHGLCNNFDAQKIVGDSARCGVFPVDVREPIDWSYCDLRAFPLMDLNLRGINLKGADLSGMDLRNVNFDGANLVRANLSRSNLTDTSFKGTMLNRSDLTQAFVWDDKRVDLGLIKSNTELDGVDLTQAITPSLESSPGLICVSVDAEEQFIGLSESAFVKVNAMLLKLPFVYAEQSSVADQQLAASLLLGFSLRANTDLTSNPIPVGVKTGFEQSPWVKFDLGESQAFNRVNMDLHIGEPSDVGGVSAIARTIKIMFADEQEFIGDRPSLVEPQVIDVSALYDQSGKIELQLEDIITARYIMLVNTTTTEGAPEDIIFSSMTLKTMDVFLHTSMTDTATSDVCDDAEPDINDQVLKEFYTELVMTHERLLASHSKAEYSKDVASQNSTIIKAITRLDGQRNQLVWLLNRLITLFKLVPNIRQLKPFKNTAISRIESLAGKVCRHGFSIKQRKCIPDDFTKIEESLNRLSPIYDVITLNSILVIGELKFAGIEVTKLHNGDLYANNMLMLRNLIHYLYPSAECMKDSIVDSIPEASKKAISALIIREISEPLAVMSAQLGIVEAGYFITQSQRLADYVDLDTLIQLNGVQMEMEKPLQSMLDNQYVKDVTRELEKKRFFGVPRSCVTPPKICTPFGCWQPPKVCTPKVGFTWSIKQILSTDLSDIPGAGKYIAKAEKWANSQINKVVDPILNELDIIPEPLDLNDKLSRLGGVLDFTADAIPEVSLSALSTWQNKASIAQLINLNSDETAGVVSHPYLPSDNDFDGDELLNAHELQLRSGVLVEYTSPYNSDFDLDGMPDNYEKKIGLIPTYDDGQLDLNGDGISNLEEYQTGPEIDKDGDGVEDESDNCPNIANPNQLDSDNDEKGDACDDDINIFEVLLTFFINWVKSFFETLLGLNAA